MTLVEARGVEVDLEAGVLRVTARSTGFGKPELSREFPLLSMRRCTKCKSPVSIYAAGSLQGLQKEAEAKLFEGPAESCNGWALLKEKGGFALVAKNGHAFVPGKYRAMDPECHHGEVELVFPAKA